jgi:hypothetical protein
MTGRAAVWLLLAPAALIAATSTADARPIAAAVLASPDDVRAAVLVGPAGEVYEPDAPGTWKRRVGGGVAGDVTGAAAGGGDLFAIGASTPLYRRRAGSWQAMRLGQRGAVVLGTGPVPAVAIGRHVFLQSRAGWTRVGQAPLPVTALWAGGDRDVVLAAGGVLWRLRGASWMRLPRPQAPIGVAGATASGAGIAGSGPWALTARVAVDLARGRAVTAQSPGSIIAATTSPQGIWLLIASPTALAIERHALPPAAPLTLAPPVAGDATIAAFLADRAGRLLIATRGGDVHVWADGAWTAGAVSDELPAPRKGAAPARSQAQPQ